VLIAAVALAIFTYGVVSAMLGTLLPSLNLSGAESGIVALAQSAGLLIASLAAGPIVDTLGKKLPLTGGLLAMAATLWALPNASGYAFIALLLFLMGLGGGVMVIAVNSLVSTIGAERRASLLSLTNVFFGLGLIVTPWVSTLLGNDARRLCLLAAGLATVTFAAHAFTRIPASQNIAGGFQWSSAREMLRSPILWMLAISQCCYVACEVGVSNWLASFLIQKDIPKDDALNILAWRFGLGLLLGRVAVAPVLLRVKARVVVLCASGLMTLTTYWMLQADSPTHAGIAIFCAGLAMAPVFPGTMGMLGELFPRATSTSMSLVVTAGWMGLIVSSPAIGAIAGADKSNLPQALLLFPLLSAAMVILHLVLRKQLKSAGGEQIRDAH
jgi:fucose permease